MICGVFFNPPLVVVRCCLHSDGALLILFRPKKRQGRDSCLVVKGGTMPHFCLFSALQTKPEQKQRDHRGLL